MLTKMTAMIISLASLALLGNHTSIFGTVDRSCNSRLQLRLMVLGYDMYADTILGSYRGQRSSVDPSSSRAVYWSSWC